ncbi:MAG: DUF1573 domain-containing protein, partial [Bryobacteraceae bacterium]
SSTYQTPATAVSDDASQFTVVMSNSAGSVTSDPATLTVLSANCLVSSAAWVNSALPQVETGTLQLAFDATPSSIGIDGVVGLSSGPASAYTSLAAIVRFNPAGTIDARNGAAYTAATPIAYTAGTTYHFILDVNVTAHTYNASVVVNGVPVVIGTNLAFRTEQAGASTLSNIGAVTASGSQTICNIVVTSTPATCLSSSGSWVNSPLSQTETGAFKLAFDATPSSTGIDGVVGLSSGSASAYTSLAAIVRFNSTGTIDAMNGASYTAATAIAYSAGTTYHFILDVNVTAHTYNASVAVNGAPVVLGTNLAFRTEQAGASSLSNIGTVTSPGSQTICNIAVSAVAPSITTQPVSQTVTPGQTATFSVAGTGTAPMSYQWQKNSAAISGATSSTYQTTAATSSDNGSQFSVVVTNPAGSVTSGSATLTVSTGTFLLGASSTQVSFGSVNLSSNGVQNVMVTNSGTSNIAISNVAVSGAGFNAGGGAAGLTLSPGQAVPLSVTFAPAATGSALGSITVTSNATNSPIKIALTGTGVAQAHSVSLSWTPSTSSVTGYNVYSSRVSGGPYVKLNAAPMGGTSFTDTTVQPGQTYYYVTTAVGSSGGTSESGFSAEVSAVIP